MASPVTPALERKAGRLGIQGQPAIHESYVKKLKKKKQWTVCNQTKSTRQWSQDPILKSGLLRKSGDWRDGSVIKSMYCSYRESMSGSQYLPWRLTTLHNSSSRASDSWPLRVPVHTQAKHLDTLKNKKGKKISLWVETRRKELKRRKGADISLGRQPGWWRDSDGGHQTGFKRQGDQGEPVTAVTKGCHRTVGVKRFCFLILSSLFLLLCM